MHFQQIADGFGYMDLPEEQVQEEDARLEMRRGQRQRAKERAHALKEGRNTGNEYGFPVMFV